MDQDEQSLAALARFYEPFFEQFPNDDLRDRVGIVLRRLVDRKTEFPGPAGGWAGGIVYAVSSIGVGIPDVLNADTEKAFGVPMAMIRKRAKEVREILGDDLPLKAEWMKQATEFTIRDEANALTCYAFRTGPIEDIHGSTRITHDEAQALVAGASPAAAKLIEDIHASHRINQAEMKALMIDASSRLAKLLTMKHDKSDEYDRFIRDYGREWCAKWER